MYKVFYSVELVATLFCYRYLCYRAALRGGNYGD